MKQSKGRQSGSPYTIKQLADLSRISVRALHYYDEIGLLRPSFVKNNGYRFYEEKELLRLQQILFFRELEFSLEDIKKIIDSPNFDYVRALKDHRKLIEMKAKRLRGLLTTIDNTIKKMTDDKKMRDEELYDSFDNEEMEKYQQEAKDRWGHTEAYKQSVQRVKALGKEGMAKVQKANEELLREIAAHMDRSPADPEVQTLIARHYDGLRAFYEPSLKMYLNLGEMYVADHRFTAYFDKFSKGLAEFMRDAIRVFVSTKQG